MVVVMVVVVFSGDIRVVLSDGVVARLDGEHFFKSSDEPGGGGGGGDGGGGGIGK